MGQNCTNVKVAKEIFDVQPMNTPLSSFSLSLWDVSVFVSLLSVSGALVDAIRNGPCRIQLRGGIKKMQKKQNIRFCGKVEMKERKVVGCFYLKLCCSSKRVQDLMHCTPTPSAGQVCPAGFRNTLRTTK